MTEFKKVETCKNHENGTLFCNVLKFPDKCLVYCLLVIYYFSTILAEIDRTEKVKLLTKLC